MDIYKLINNYYANNPNGHFFDRDTLRFFGERISEMYVLKNTVKIDGKECYVVSSFQHNAPIPGRHYSYFDVKTFDYVIA